MTNELQDDPFGDDLRPYETRKPKRSLWRNILIGAGLLVALGIGSCVWGMSNLFAAASDRQPATRDFFDQVQDNGLPSAESGIWMEVSGFDQETLDELQSAIDYFGPPKSIGETGCRAHSRTTTNGPSGTYVMCTIPVVYTETPGRVEMTWRKLGDEWKVSRFFLGYDKINGYFEDKARAKIEAETEASVPASED